MTALLDLGRGRDDLDVFDEFTGFGGSLGGIVKVPGVKPRFAANHSKYVLEVSAMNYPHVEHFCGDVQRHDITKFRPCAIFWASPACPKWTNARGVVRDFDQTNQEVLPGMGGGPDEETLRSRLLMDEVHRYLEAMWMASQPVLAGVVENVIECRKWDRWRHWRGRFHAIGYKTKLVALNSGHVRPVRAKRAPQSRDRLYLVYWLEALGRDPDFDKWLRPKAWCAKCDRRVDAIQSWKRLGVDMGRYRQQYVYRCPSSTCRNAAVEPEVLGAVEAIDWSLPSTRIGDRTKALEPKTMARIGVGTVRLGVDVAQLAPAGGTWRQHSIPLTEPMPARTTRESDGVAVPPMLVPTEGRPGKVAAPVSEPARTQTTRNETGLAIPPFVATLRGGGSAKTPNLITAPLTTVTASGMASGVSFGPTFGPTCRSSTGMITSQFWPHLTAPCGWHRSVWGGAGSRWNRTPTITGGAEARSQMEPQVAPRAIGQPPRPGHTARDAHPLLLHRRRTTGHAADGHADHGRAVRPGQRSGQPRPRAHHGGGRADRAHRRADPLDPQGSGAGRRAHPVRRRGRAHRGDHGARGLPVPHVGAARDRRRDGLRPGLPVVRLQARRRARPGQRGDWLRLGGHRLRPRGGHHRRGPRPRTRRTDRAVQPGGGDLGMSPACRGASTALFFSTARADVRVAQDICIGCPLRVQCLAGALKRREPWGVWGGELFEHGRIITPRPKRVRRPAPARGQVTEVDTAVARLIGEGLTPTRIAARLRIPLTEAQVLVKRARRRIRQQQATRTRQSPLGKVA